MKVCDLTQFYSPVGGGVRRYLSEKARYVRESTEDDEHVLIVPGAEDAMTELGRTRTYSIRSPLISRTSRYRALLRLDAIEEILEREQPSLIESGDPYQVAWKAVHSGMALQIPVVGFYHSHFPEAYVRTIAKYCGSTLTEFFLDFSRRYVRNLYNRFERTFVPAPALGDLLSEWGVENVALTDLGVDIDIFRPEAPPGENLRQEWNLPPKAVLLLYVGRLAQEKNTQTLAAAFLRLHAEEPGRFHLCVVGDGMQRPLFEKLQIQTGAVTHQPYCAAAEKLAACYRAADLFVHPGVQETFGLVTLEAQACGTPVIGIRGSYMDRIVHSDQTLWAQENSPEALARAIQESAQQSRAGAALASRHVAAQYSWTQVFTRLFDLYREVVQTYTPR